MKSKEYIEASKDFGKRLKILMQQKNISTIELAKEINVDNHTLSRWLEGKSLPRLKHLITLAKFFKVKTDYFLGLLLITESE